MITFIIKYKNICLKKLKYIRTPTFIAALLTVPRAWKQPKSPSMDDWIKTTWHVCTMEDYTAIRKDEMLPFGRGTDLENIMLSKVKLDEKKLRTI